MGSSGQMTTPALEALREGKLSGFWTLDPHLSQIRFRIKVLWGLMTVNGSFRQVSGNGVVTPAGQVSGSITVAAGSIDTRNDRRDRHLRSAVFFEVDRYPDVTFRVDRVEPADQGVTVNGRLNVHGRTRWISFTALVASTDNDEIGLDAEVQVDRADLGLSWNRLGMASKTTTVAIHAVFTRQ